MTKCTENVRGWSCRTMVLERPANMDKSKARPTVLVVGAVLGCLDIFSHLSYFFPCSLSQRETRYRLKYCFKGSLKPNQPTQNVIC